MLCLITGGAGTSTRVDGSRLSVQVFFACLVSLAGVVSSAHRAIWPARRPRAVTDFGGRGGPAQNGNLQVGLSCEGRQRYYVHVLMREAFGGD
jgi:hypothetical protein